MGQEILKLSKKSGKSQEILWDGIQCFRKKYVDTDLFLIIHQQHGNNTRDISGHITPGRNHLQHN